MCVLALLHDFEQDLAMKLLFEAKAGVSDADVRKRLSRIQERFELYDFDEAERLIKACISGDETDAEND